MTLTLKAIPREAGNAGKIRDAGQIPTALYGPEIEPQSIALDYNTFDKLYSEAGESSLIDVQIEGQKEPVTVLIQEVQYHPVTRDIMHVDLRQIKMGEEIDATIFLNFVGQAPAVKSEGGTLITSVESINVRCLPKDLVSSIDVDLSMLDSIDRGIHTKDLPLPESFTLMDDPETMVASVLAPRSEEEIAALEEELLSTGPASVDDIEVEGESNAEEGKGSAEEKSSEESEDNA